MKPKIKKGRTIDHYMAYLDDLKLKSPTKYQRMKHYLREFWNGPLGV